MSALLALPTWGLLLISAFMASIGQVLFKLGASGRSTLLEYINWPVFGGLSLYGLSTVLWILALSREKLTTVYPFSVLTFVLVYAGAILFLGERPGAKEIAGVLLVLAGLALLVHAHSG